MVSEGHKGCQGLLQATIPEHSFGPWLYRVTPTEQNTKASVLLPP